MLLGAETGEALRSSAGLQTPAGEGLTRALASSASWCPYSQKSWLQLEEKQIPYTMERINMRWAVRAIRGVLSKAHETCSSSAVEWCRCYGSKPPSYQRLVQPIPCQLLIPVHLSATMLPADISPAISTRRFWHA